MKKIVLIALTLAFVFSFTVTTSCKKKKDDPAPNPTAAQTYVVVTDSTWSYLWIDGTATKLTTDTANFQSIAMSGNTAYVAGSVKKSGVYQASVWKNGAITSFTNGITHSYAYDVCVAGGKEYVVGATQPTGTINNAATIWIDGVKAHYHDGSTYSRANAVFVDGSNVYVAGTIGNQAYVWVNGNGTALPQGAYTTDIFVANGKVYVTGYSGSPKKAMLWVDNVPTELGNGEARSVFVSGNDVYVAGYETVSGSNTARYWKNGVETVLATGSTYPTALSIYVKDGDVYVSGREGQDAKYWKNGTGTSIRVDQGAGRGQAILVK